MLALLHAKDRLRAFFRLGQVRHALLSILFGLLVVALYYTMRLLVPKDLLARDELATIGFILISVFLLFPAREWILSRLLSRYDFLTFYGHDLHHLEILARQFTMEELREQIFLEFSDWLGVTKTTLAILDARKKFYRYYLYMQGEPVREYKGNVHFDEIGRYLKSRKMRMEALDTKLPQGIQKSLEAIEAVLVYPFVFRRNLMGFLVLHKHPRHPFAERALQYFSDKAAVAIQNDLLFQRVLDSRLYEEELESARRIQDRFHEIRIPLIDCFEIEPRPTARSVVEFFRKSKDQYYLVALSTDRLTSASRIILYGLLGTLHAVLEREPEMRINELLTHLKADSELNRTEYRIDILIAEIQAASPVLTILHGGNRYSVYDGSSPQKNLLSLGWRNILELQTERVYIFSYHTVPVLAIRYTCRHIS